MSEPLDGAVRGGRNAFFKDPDVDRLLAMLLQMVNEHWVLNERVRALESLLEQHGVLGKGELEAFMPEGEQDQQWDAESYTLIRRIISAGRNIDNRNRTPE